MTLEGWLTQEEAAEKLNIALDTMRRWVRLGYFPRTRVGKRYLIPANALEEFLQSRLEHGVREVKPRKPKEATTLKSGTKPKTARVKMPAIKPKPSAKK